MPWKAHGLFPVTAGTAKGDNPYSPFTSALGRITILDDESGPDILIFPTLQAQDIVRIYALDSFIWGHARINQVLIEAAPKEKSMYQKLKLSK